MTRPPPLRSAFERATLTEPSRRFFSRAHPFERLRTASSIEALLRRSTIHIGSTKEVLVASETDGGVRVIKAARNQALWREVNERIKAVVETSGRVEFLCECANLDCTETMSMSMAEYKRIRSSPTRFPIAVGHDFPEVERVVEVSDGYAVVEKKGAAAEEVAKLDPRSRA
jgi:hypothetical protein